MPDIAVDPDSGTTLGVIPTILVTDENDDIRKIIAPDLVHNPYFGWGVHGRIYNYTSPDEQWSIVSGIYERVQREFDGEYQIGRLRDTDWSFNGSAIYDVDGTPRFYGIGNESPAINETDYTAQSYLRPGAARLQFQPRLAAAIYGSVRDVDVLPGTLSTIASIQTRFANLLGEGTNKQVLNRLSLVYDTRDDIIIPSKGAEVVAYARPGEPQRHLQRLAVYGNRIRWARVLSRAGQDRHRHAHGAALLADGARCTLLGALEQLGGADTVVGGAQPLRGFGDGRFYDRDSFSSSVEFRRIVATFHAVATQVEIELAPFVDVGRVFDRTSTLPFEQLHKVYGVGFRGLARPVRRRLRGHRLRQRRRRRVHRHQLSLLVAREISRMLRRAQWPAPGALIMSCHTPSYLESPCASVSNAVGRQE